MLSTKWSDGTKGRAAMSTRDPFQAVKEKVSIPTHTDNYLFNSVSEPASIDRT